MRGTAQRILRQGVALLLLAVLLLLLAVLLLLLAIDNVVGLLQSLSFTLSLQDEVEAQFKFKLSSLGKV